MALMVSSVPNAKSPNDPRFDQSDEFLLAGVVPAQMEAASVALAKGPGVASKPGMLQSRDSGRLAAECLIKGDYLEANPVRVCESELIFAFELESILFICHAVEAPGAKPVPRGGTAGCGRTVSQSWFKNSCQ